MNLLYKLRSRFSEPYRIRNGFGLNAIRNEREAKALYDFCVNELADKRHMDLNPERCGVYEHYVELYQWTFMEMADKKYKLYKGYMKFLRGSRTSTSNIYAFARDNAGWFWN
jgi:hypothetical protein